ncbi:bh protein [Fusibacter ferrireducens]|uniref:Bh protein n=1 Tax=Fusibacter ferrireducens TaxID=2785058 RepID=A0ABR9ZXI6_9FIRM|nr:bh protein [Fusibacter ferrireducens]MBF4694309.1 bh protein [Fusibacter ferrireducens]
MKISKVDVILFCTQCNEDTDHEVIYFDSEIESLTCIECGKTTGLNHSELLSQYKHDWLTRIISKPHRMTEEMRKNLYDFIKNLPARMITKPKRVYNEVEDIKKIEKD